MILSYFCTLLISLDSLLMLIYNHAPQDAVMESCNITLSVVGVQELGNATIRRIDEGHTNVFNTWVLIHHQFSFLDFSLSFFFTRFISKYEANTCVYFVLLIFVDNLIG